MPKKVRELKLLLDKDGFTWRLGNGEITMNPRYSILIQWSEEDQKYIVSFPEFGPYAHTHGETYEEVLQNAQEVLELLVEDYQARGQALPEPGAFPGQAPQVA